MIKLKEADMTHQGVEIIVLVVVYARKMDVPHTHCGGWGNADAKHLPVEKYLRFVNKKTSDGMVPYKKLA